MSFSLCPLGLLSGAQRSLKLFWCSCKFDTWPLSHFICWYLWQFHHQSIRDIVCDWETSSVEKYILLQSKSPSETSNVTSYYPSQQEYHLSGHCSRPT